MPAPYDFVFVVGDDLILDLDFDVNLTGYSLTAAVSSPEGTVTQLTVTITNAVNGLVTVSLPSATTATMYGSYRWDLRWRTPDGRIETLLSGRAAALPSVAPIPAAV